MTALEFVAKPAFEVPRAALDFTITFFVVTSLEEPLAAPNFAGPRFALDAFAHHIVHHL